MQATARLTSIEDNSDNDYNDDAGLFPPSGTTVPVQPTSFAMQPPNPYGSTNVAQQPAQHARSHSPFYPYNVYTSPGAQPQQLLMRFPPTMTSTATSWMQFDTPYAAPGMYTQPVCREDDRYGMEADRLMIL